jgi:large subunit ribosomal protein L4
VEEVKSLEAKRNRKSKTWISRSPIWVGGGVTFGPRNEINFKRTIPKKIRRKALLEIIEEKEKTNNIVIVPEIKVTKTKEAKEFLIKSSISESALIVLNQLDKLTILAFRNIPKTKTIQAKDLNCLDVLTLRKILTKDCLEEIKKSINK